MSSAKQMYSYDGLLIWKYVLIACAAELAEEEEIATLTTRILKFPLLQMPNSFRHCRESYVRFRMLIRCKKLKLESKGVSR